MRAIRDEALPRFLVKSVGPDDFRLPGLRRDGVCLSRSGDVLWLARSGVIELGLADGRARNFHTPVRGRPAWSVGAGAAAICGACSLMVAYQLAPRCDSQLKPCRMISCPSPAAGPVLVAPPPCRAATEFRAVEGLGLSRTSRSRSPRPVLAQARDKQGFLKCPFTRHFDRLADQFCQSLDRLSDQLLSLRKALSWGAAPAR